MQYKDIQELCYITHIDNLPSILEKGVLSHQGAECIPHKSVAMPAVQKKRQAKIIPLSSRLLHSYVNLYINARNAMLYVLKDQFATLCVLSIKSNVWDLPGSLIADRNAATDEVNFFEVPAGFSYIRKEEVLHVDGLKMVLQILH